MNEFRLLRHNTILAVAILTPETEELAGVSAVANLGQNGARCSPQGVHHHADTIYLFPELEVKKTEGGLWYSV